jgi:hypothetical protein
MTRNVFVASTYIKLRKTINLQNLLVNREARIHAGIQDQGLGDVQPWALEGGKGDATTVNKSVRKVL